MESIVRALHLVFEEHRLSILGASALPKLGALNVLLAAAVGDSGLVARYVSELGDEVLHQTFQPLLCRVKALDRPPPADVFVWLARCLELRSQLEQFPVFPLRRTYSWQLGFATTRSPTELTEKVVRAFSELAVGRTDADIDRFVRAMVECEFRAAEVKSLQFGPRLVISDALLVCRSAPRESWPAEAYALIGREDLATEIDAREDGEEVLGWTSVVRINSEAVAAADAAAAAAAASSSASATATTKNNRVGVSGGSEWDGCEIEDASLRMRFGADQRMEEVRRLLRSSEPVPLRAPEGGEIDPGDARHQAIFMKKLMRSLAAGVGRGALVLHTYAPPDPTEKLHVPKINLTGRLINRKGALVNFEDVSITEEGLGWPDFHNGAAAGLRVVKGGEDILTRTWIVYNKPQGSGSTTYAGVLLALGISGHLPSLRVTDWYQHLRPRHQLVSLALMLGIGACNCRTMSPVASKLLGLHVRHFNAAGFSQADWFVSLQVQVSVSFLVQNRRKKKNGGKRYWIATCQTTPSVPFPPSALSSPPPTPHYPIICVSRASRFFFPPAIQSAAVVGLGLLYMGSSHRVITEGMVAELTRRPLPSENPYGREGKSSLPSFFSLSTAPSPRWVVV